MRDETTHEEHTEESLRRIAEALERLATTAEITLSATHPSPSHMARLEALVREAMGFAPVCLNADWVRRAKDVL